MENVSVAPRFGFSFTQGARVTCFAHNNSQRLGGGGGRGAAQLRRRENAQNSPDSTSLASNNCFPWLHGGSSSPSATSSLNIPSQLTPRSWCLLWGPAGHTRPGFVTSLQGPGSMSLFLPFPGSAEEFPADLLRCWFKRKPPFPFAHEAKGPQ